MAQDAFVGASALAADELALRVTEHYERRGRELWGLAAFDPAVVDGVSVNVPLTVTGHFDDAAAGSCEWREPADWANEPAAVQHLRCSEIFVVTAIEGRE